MVIKRKPLRGNKQCIVYNAIVRLGLHPQNLSLQSTFTSIKLPNHKYGGELSVRFV
jgi:hypothetical protein